MIYHYRDSSAKVRLDFSFDDKEAWQSNSNGEIPRWRFPRIAKVSCEYSVSVPVGHDQGIVLPGSFYPPEKFVHIDSE